MRRLTRFRALFAFVALAAFACAPHRPSAVTGDAPRPSEHGTLHAALTTLVVEPAFVTQPSRTVVAAADSQRQGAGDVVVVMLAGIALTAGLRPRHAQAVERSHNAEHWDTQPARLRAPPLFA
jgi:hypothetical protein